MRGFLRSTVRDRLGRVGAMKWQALILLSLLLSPTDANAQARKCFSPSEAVQIQTVRHGIRLRETAAQCQEYGFSPDAVTLWQKIDQAIGTQFKAATDQRRQAYQREFGAWGDWNVSMWDGRIVQQFRNRPINRELCVNLDALLKEVDVGGWAAFTKQAVKLRDEVRLDYKVCGK